MDQVISEAMGVERSVSHTQNTGEVIAHPIGSHDAPFRSSTIHAGIDDRVALAVDPWYRALSIHADRPDLLDRLLYVHFVKRALDVLAAVILLVVLLPILLVVALAITVSDRGAGPVLFRQTRVGLGGESFTMYKFRTMIPDRRKRQVPIDFPDRRQRHKSEADPRVTKIGRLLRRTSLDELPQLLNVLKGDMSLVGPRPELPNLVAQYQPWQHRRHLVRPGITGWWQINGRSTLPMHLNTELDIYYVDNTSLWLDVKILVRTALAVLGKGAY